MKLCYAVVDENSNEAVFVNSITGIVLGGCRFNMDFVTLSTVDRLARLNDALPAGCILRKHYPYVWKGREHEANQGVQ